jgi:hypothetical protein
MAKKRDGPGASHARPEQLEQPNTHQVIAGGSPDQPTRLTFRLTLRAEPHGDSIRNLRAALKALKRRYRFQCISIEQVRQ